jgi:hypothetical protein
MELYAGSYGILRRWGDSTLCTGQGGKAVGIVGGVRTAVPWSMIPPAILLDVAESSRLQAGGVANAAGSTDND